MRFDRSDIDGIEWDFFEDGPTFALGVDRVDIDEEVVVREVADLYSPGEVFSREALEEWARENGFERRGEDLRPLIDAAIKFAVSQGYVKRVASE